MRKISAFITAAALALCFCTRSGAELYTSARSAILIVPKTGTVLYQKNAYEQRAMASTTKIMTAVLTIEAGDLDRQFEVDEYAIQVEGTSMGLRMGDLVTRRALVYGMLLPSGNDAANAAAVSVSGSISAFVELMNQKAEELGLKNTHFANPHGLDAKWHYTTAYDLATLAAYAAKNEIFREICCLQSATLKYGNPPYSRTLYNSNKMLRNYSGANGIKTGFTDNARRCLVSMAKRDGVELIAVTLNAGDDWNDHAKMLDYGFSVAKAVTPEYDVRALKTDVVGGVKDTLSAKLGKKIEIPVTGGQAAKITVKTLLPKFVYAPIEKNDRLGKLVIYLDGKEIDTIPLLAAESISAVKYEPSLLDKIRAVLAL